VPLEKALGAFDLFILHDQKGDLVEVCLEFSMPDIALTCCHRFRICSMNLLLVFVGSIQALTKCQLVRKLLVH
jgi:hypothetical protein